MQPLRPSCASMLKVCNVDLLVPFSKQEKKRSQSPTTAYAKVKGILLIHITILHVPMLQLKKMDRLPLAHPTLVRLPFLGVGHFSIRKKKYKNQPNKTVSTVQLNKKWISSLLSNCHTLQCAPSCNIQRRVLLAH